MEENEGRKEISTCVPPSPTLTLLIKSEGRALIQRKQVMLGTAAHTYNPRPGEVEPGGGEVKAIFGYIYPSLAFPASYTKDALRIDKPNGIPDIFFLFTFAPENQVSKGSYSGTLQ